MKTPPIPSRALERLAHIFAEYPELVEVVLFGSRATGKASKYSDIDLAVRGIVERQRLARLIMDLEETIPVAQKWDVKSYENIKYKPLKNHIDRFGVTIYQAGHGLSVSLAKKRKRT